LTTRGHHRVRSKRKKKGAHKTRWALELLERRETDEAKTGTTPSPD
jgi:hypothetical protein